MLKIEIIYLGKIKENYFKEAIEEYVKRVQKFCSIKLINIKDEKLPDNPSEAQIEAALNKEGKEILKKVNGNKFIAMCIEGKEISSTELAKKIENYKLNGCDKLIFVIGSSYGLSEEVKQRADLKLSMSKMTFAHRLACTMLCEQIYRAFNIINSGKYHK